MSDDDKKIVATAINFMQAILSYGEPSPQGISELYEIKRGNKKVILVHLKAINNITSRAIGIIEGNNEK